MIGRNPSAGAFDVLLAPGRPGRMSLIRIDEADDRGGTAMIHLAPKHLVRQ
ncbi:hypothetical protein [Streptosporangium sp. OZ121]|uniref:hypothetical protein n=1 Tax=Streptosporangium sp. OZ121 TaxID=3444183 RepID=UPI003F7B20F7